WEDTLLIPVLGNDRREGGGFLIAPRASVCDGAIDFCAVSTIPRMMMLYTIPYFLKGTQAHLSYVRLGQLRHLELHSDRPLFIHTDGEIYAAYHSTVRQLTVEAVPSAIRVVAPALEG
ncbi:diacylglycerol/lipid kinase family protein, partial [Anaerolinea sp.]|uniref:diacylglycerol/lipid kinase family protein n=1 Tax=Anaerolinea sp. TaxID=1872519 RepID=UPI002FDAEFA0